MKGICHDVMARRRGVGRRRGRKPGGATVDVEGTDFGDFEDMGNGGLWGTGIITWVAPRSWRAHRDGMGCYLPKRKERKSRIWA